MFKRDKTSIIINGVEHLHSSEINVIPDRIEAGTLLCATAITGGNIRLQKVIPEHIKTLTNKLEELQEKYEKASKTEQDKLAIEAGKLLVEEILHNTIDNTNLIDKCEKGGKINGSI